MESEIPGPVDLPLQAPDAPPATKKLTLKHILAYAIGNFPAGLVLLVVETWLMRLYCPSPDETGRTLLVSPKAFGRLFIVVLIIGAIADPLVGFFSDRTRSRFGRRLPYIFLGTPLLALSFVLMWFPPVNAESFTNVLWLTGTLIGVHVFFTVVVNPYLALMPELWTSEVDRVKVSAWMSGANVLAQVFAFGLLGWLITRFEGGVHLGGFLIADGYKIGALVAGVVTVAFFLPLMIGIRETPHHASKEVPFGLVKASLETLKNPAFVPYIIAGSMLGAAQVLIVTVIPYMVSVFLGESDDFAGAMLTGLVVLSAVMFPFAEMASEKFRKKTLFMASLIAFMVLLPATTMIGLLPASVSIRMAGEIWMRREVAHSRISARLNRHCSLIR